MIRYLIQRPTIVFLIAFMIVSAGIASTWILPMKIQPIVQSPTIIVDASVENDRDLNEMEREIGTPLEDIALNSDIVKKVQITTSTKRVRLHLEIRDSAKEKQIDDLKEELNRRLNSVPFKLESSEVRQYSTADQSFMQIAIIPEDLSDSSVREEIQNIVVPALRKITGIRRVTHSLQDYEPQYIFELREDQIPSIQKTASLINELQQSFKKPLLGTLQYNGGTHRVQSEADISSLEELYTYRLHTGQMLQDVIEIKEQSGAEGTLFSEVNGSPYYGINLVVADTADEVRISKQVKELMRELKAQQATPWDSIYIWDSSEFIGQAVKEVVTNIVIGAFVAIIILFFIFRSIKTTIIVGISIPVSISSALLMMYLFEYSINIVTLMGLGIGIGMIVDACIVVLENIFKKIEDGIERSKAIIEGTKEVATPVISSILTTVIVFVPIGYLDGEVGAMAKELALTVIVALLSSLIVSLTMIPIFSYYLMNQISKSPLQQRLIERYELLLHYVMDRKWRTLVLFILLLVGSVYSLMMFVPKNYIPNVSERAYFVSYQTDEKTSYEVSKQLMTETALKMKEIDGIQNVFYWGNKNSSEWGRFYIHYLPQEEMNRSDHEVNQDIHDLIDRDIPYTFARFSSGQSDVAGQVQLSVTAATMQRIVEQVPLISEELRLLHGVTGVESSLTRETEEWGIQFSREKLSSYGLSREQVEQYVQFVLNGVDNVRFQLNGEEKMAKIVFPELYREGSDALSQLPIHDELPLTLAHVSELVSHPAELNRVRKDGSYEMGVTIHFQTKDKEMVLEQVDQFLKDYGNGETHVSYSGTQQQQNEAFQKLIIAGAIAFSIVFLVLTIQFNRLRQPFMIMVSLPFAMIGVCLGFIITGRVFDILAMIGIIMLIGIVVNNAIILIDFVNKRQNEYDTAREAIIEAAKARVRPIFTTTSTTIGGLIPMFIGGSSTSDFQTPIATAVIFGLLFSTFVSLLLLPIIYELFEGRKNKVRDDQVVYVA